MMEVVREAGSVDAPTGEIAETVDVHAPDAPDRDIAPGASLGRFLVIDELGRGGMGVVLRAYDPKLQREVAVKILRREALSTDSRDDGSVGWERLVREARAMARVSHPNVVGVHDVDLELHGGAMVVMEYVPGTNLQRWLGQKQREPSEILEAFAAAGRGLTAAHQQGVLHRDFKPSNVLMGEGGTIKVTDFGLARAVAGPPSGDSEDSLPLVDEDSLALELTGHGVVLGTPRYMPPEQFRGDDLDARTDQYAFCVSLWRALTGAWPYENQQAKARQEPPQWPRVTGVSRQVSDTLRRGLRADPEQRWPDMSTLLAELDRDPRRARRRLAAVAVLGLGAVGLWGSVNADSTRRAQECADKADAVTQVWNPQRSDTLGQAFDAVGVSYATSTWERLRPRLDEYAQQWAEARSSVCSREQIERTLDPATAELAATCLDENFDRFVTLLDDWEDLEPPDVRQALQGAAGLPPIAMCTDPTHLSHRALAPEDAETREQVVAIRRTLTESRSAYTTARYEAALRRATAARDDAEALGWAPVTAEARIARGSALAALGRYDEAEADLEEALVQAGGAGQDILVAKAATKLVAVVGGALARYDDALRWGRIASMTLERLNLDKHVVVATMLSNVGRVHHSRREFDQALAAFQDSLQMREELLGPDSLATSDSLNAVGRAYYARSEYETALTYYERALEIRRRHLGPDHPDVADQIHNIGNVHDAHGDHERALAAFHRALDIRERALGPDHPSLGSTLTNIARTHEQLGDRDKGRRYYEQAKTILERALGPDHLDVGDAIHALGAITYDMGDRAAAISYFERALAIRERGDAPLRRVAQTRFSLGQAMWDGGGDRTRAYEIAAKSLEEYRSLGREEQIIAIVVEAWLEGHPPPGDSGR